MSSEFCRFWHKYLRHSKCSKAAEELPWNLKRYKISNRIINRFTPLEALKFMKSGPRPIKVVLVMLSIIAIFGVTACSKSAAQTIPTTPPPFTTTTPPPSTTAAVVLDGATLFANTCARCHNLSEIAPTLSSMSHSDLVAFIKGHLADPLTDAQRDVLANYLGNNCADDG